MGIVHYLNVKNGDCSIIEHPSGHITVIDVCNARKDEDINSSNLFSIARIIDNKNFYQKSNPTNPITYMQRHGITNVFRFILTHPDMDHMDGIKDFFEEFNPTNFWDIKNKCIKSDWGKGAYRKEDWDFYCSIRDKKTEFQTKRLTMYAETLGQFFNKNENGEKGGDGLYILSPTQNLVNYANTCDDYNDTSYVILYRSKAGKILFAGDSHDKTWEHILDNYSSEVKNMDILIAPHHGRDSGRSYEFLDIINPKLTLFGNAPSKHLSYGQWHRKNLNTITNNQAGNIIIDTNKVQMQVYITNKNYAEQQNSATFYCPNLKAYYLKEI